MYAGHYKERTTVTPLKFQFTTDLDRMGKLSAKDDCPEKLGGVIVVYGYLCLPSTTTMKIKEERSTATKTRGWMSMLSFPW